VPPDACAAARPSELNPSRKTPTLLERMDGLLICGAALGVGAIVYALSFRSSSEPLETDALPPADGATGLPLEGGPEDEAFIYVPVLHSADPEWRTRVGAVVGLILLVTAAAFTVAVAIYEVGHALNRMIRGYMGY
jgi:hypothetical protein